MGRINGPVVDIGLFADVDKLLDTITNKLSNAKTIGLDKVAAKDIKNIEDMVDSLRKGISDISHTKVNTSSFAKAQKEILDRVALLEDRTNALEKNLTSLVTTLSKADGTNFSKVVRDLSVDMENLATATQKTITELGSMSTSASRKELEELSKILQSITNASEKQFKVTNFKKVETAIKGISEAYDKYFDIQSKIEDLQYGGISTVEDQKQLANLQKELLTVGETINTMIDNGAKKFGDSFFSNQINSGTSLEQLSLSIEQDLNDILKNVQLQSKRIQEEISSIVSTPSASSVDSSQLKVDVKVSTTKKGLESQLRELLDSVKPFLAENPIEANISFKTDWGTKQSNKLLKDFQKRIDDISEEADVSELNNMLDEVRKSFANELGIRFTSNFDEERKAITAGLSALRREVKTKFDISPNIELTDVAAKRTQRQLDKISKQLVLSIGKVELSEPATEKFGKLVQKKLGNSTSEAEALENVIDLILSKIDGVDNTLTPISNVLTSIKNIIGTFPIDEITESTRELVSLLQQVFGVVSSSDLDGMFDNIAKDVSNITGKLQGGNLKAIRDVLAAFKEYKNLGGTKNVSDLGGAENVQKWLNKNFTDAVSNNHISNRGLALAKDYAYGIRSGIPTVEQAARDLAKVALDALADEQDSHSDSKKTIKIGKDYTGGYKTGIQSGKKDVAKAAKDIADAAADNKHETIRQNASYNIDKIHSYLGDRDILTVLSNLERGFQKVEKLSPTLSQALKSLGFISDNGNLQFETIGGGARDNAGWRNRGLAISDDIIMVTRGREAETEDLKDLIKEAKDAGAYVAEIVGYFKNGVETYEFQEKAPGQNVSKLINANDFNPSIESLTQLVKTVQILFEHGLTVDIVNDNIMFDKKSGVFTPIDLATYAKGKGLGNNANNAYDLLKEYFRRQGASSQINTQIKDIWDSLGDGKVKLSGTSEAIEETGKAAKEAAEALNEYAEAKERAAKDTNDANKNTRRFLVEENAIKKFTAAYEKYISLIKEYEQLSKTDPDNKRLALLATQMTQRVKRFPELSSINSSADNQFDDLLDSFLKSQNPNWGKQTKQDLVKAKNETSSGLMDFIGDRYISEEEYKALEYDYDSVIEKAKKAVDAKKELIRTDEKARQEHEALTKSVDQFLKDNYVSEESFYNELDEFSLENYEPKYAEESAEGLEKESSKLKSISKNADKAAISKEEFVAANKDVLKSIVESLKGLDNEGKAFENLNKLLNNLGGTKGNQKLESTKEGIAAIIQLLSQPIDDSSFIGALERIAKSGSNLGDIAAILKASKKDLFEAKKVFDSIANDELDDLMKNHVQEIAQKAREELLTLGGDGSQFINMSDLKQTKDGFIEIVGLIRTADDKLQEFTLHTKDGINMQNVGMSENTARIAKQMKVYAQVQQFFERMQAQGKNVTDGAFFDKDADPELWQMLLDYAKEYHKELGNILSITTQVRQASNGDLLQSFSLNGDTGAHVTIGREGETVAGHQDLINVENLEKRIKALASRTKEYHDLVLKIDTTGWTNANVTSLKEIEDEYSAIVKLVKEYADTLGDSTNITEVFNSALNQMTVTFNNKEQSYIDTVSKSLSDALNNPNNKNQEFTQSFNQELTVAISKVDELQNLINQHGNTNAPWSDDELQKLRELHESIDQTVFSIKDLTNILSKSTSIDKLLTKINKDLNDQSAMPRELKMELIALRDEIDETRKSLNGLNKVDYADLEGRFQRLHEQVTRLNRGLGFFEQIAKAAKTQTVQFLARYFSLQDIIRYSRELAQNVINIDTAITELRKVSDASNERLSQSFEKSAETAQELGQTIQHVINVTADWARLGYDVDQAEELARVTALFTSVGDNMSADDASSYLISTLQGFQMEADQAEDIIDKYNQVANNFAIDTAGIGESLKRSAASFNAANTDLSEAIALVTATNEVVQNPESVGTLWKTMSARIRGAKTELEDLGEEQDEYTKTTSKLRDLVKGLTGFDIMLDEDTFKSVYEIVLGIGKEWDKLTDVERASLGEALAGKRNANGLYAVLGNLDTLQEAYEAAEHASGSAAREQENYAKSVQYSLDRFKASIEEISYDFLNSQLLKSAVEFANTIIQGLDAIIDKSERITYIIGGLISALMTVKKIGLNFQYDKELGLTTTLFGQGLNSTNPDFVAIKEFGRLLDDGVEPAIAMKNALKDCSEETQKYAQSCISGNKSTKEIISGFNSGSVAGKAFSTSIKAIGASLLSFGVNLAISAAISTLVNVVVALAGAEKELAERTKQLGDEYANTKEDIDGYKSEISKLYETLNDSTSSYEESKAARERLLSIQDELIDKYGKERGVIEDITDAIDGEVGALDRLSQAKWQETKNAMNSPESNGLYDRMRYWWNTSGYEGGVDKAVQAMQGVNTYHLNMSNQDLSGGDTSGLSEADVRLLKSITESYEDLNLVFNETSGLYYLAGDEMHSFYDALLQVQGQVERYGGSDKLNEWLKRTATNAKETIDTYGSFYDAFIQNEKISKNANYAKGVDDITEAVRKYNEEYKKGFENDEARDAAIEELSGIWDGVLGNIDDTDVVGYVERLYPEIKAVTDSWKFDLNFEANENGFRDKIQNELDRFQRANGGYVSYESLRNFSREDYDASDDRVLAYYELEKAAAEYGMTVDGLIDKLKEEKILLTDGYQEIVQRYGQANIDSLGLEDLEIAITLSKQSFKSWDEFKKAIASAKEEIRETQEAAKEPLSFTQSISDLNDLETALDNVGTAIANIDEHGNFQLGDLDKIADYFLSLESAENKVEYETEAVANALKMLGEGSGSIEQQADAINTLADNYLHTSNILDGLNEKNKELYIIRLQEMGIINAEAIVIETLNQQKAIETDVDQVLADRGKELISITATEIQELIDEGVVTQDTARYIAALAAQKQLANFNALDTSADINNLVQLLNTLGATTSALETYNKVKNGANGMPSGVITEYKKQAEAEIKNALNVAKSTTQARYNVPKAQYNGGSSVKNKLGYSPASAADAINGVSAKAAKDAADAAGKAADDAKDSFKEFYDYFERLIKVLDQKISLLEAHLEDVVGSFAKNSLIDAEEDLVKSKMEGYSSAIGMYAQKASEALSKIPSDVAAKLVNGAVAIEDFVGEGNEEVYNAIQDYEKWADKVADCKQQLVELKEKIRQLELQKFNNIVEDFTNQFDLRQSAGIDLISKQIDLLKEAGELIGESFYQKQIDQAQKQVAILDSERQALVKQMNEALSSGIDVGSEEWLSMVNKLTEVEGSILDCKKAVEEFDNALLELHTEVFNRIQDQFAAFAGELDNMRELIADDSLPVATVANQWTTEGLAQLGLLSQQYELSTYQVEQYNQEIDRLNQLYLAGRYSATEYADKLVELKQAQWDAVNAAESAKEAIVDLNKARVDIVVEGIEEEIKAYEDLINKQKDALQAEKDLNDYRRSVEEANKSVIDIQRQLAAIEEDSSQSAIAKRKKLEQELSEARQNLADIEYDHSIDSQQDALDQQLTSYEELRQKEIDALQESLLNEELIIAESFERVRANSQLIGETILATAQQHGIEMSQALTDSWFAGETAIAHYGELLTAATSAFIGNIMGVEYQTWELQAQANATAEGLANMFATRADNLVQQLTDSYMSEANLQAMTDALGDALTNTIDGSYSGAGAAAALESIAGAANDVASAAENAASALRSMMDAQNAAESKSTPNVTTIYGGPDGRSRQVDWTGYGTNIESYKVNKRYARGTKGVSSSELAWTQEQGPEMILSPTTGAVLTPLQKNDMVLPTDQTANIWEWSKFDPTDFARRLIQSVPNNGGNVQANTMQVGSLVTVNGNVNDTMEMMQIASTTAATKIKQSFNELSNGLNK